MNEIDNFFVWAKSNSWKIEFSSDKEQFTDEIIQRYSSIPVEYNSFYEQIHLCTNQSDTHWFLCKNDFLETSKDTFVEYF